MNLKLAFLTLTALASSYSFGQTKLEDLHVDTTITGFHFVADFQGAKVFTKNGPPDIQTMNPKAFSFTLAPNTAATTAKEQLEMLLAMSKQNGYVITGINRRDTTLKGNSAYYISYTETDDKANCKNTVFNALVIKGKR